VAISFSQLENAFQKFEWVSNTFNKDEKNCKTWQISVLKTQILPRLRIHTQSKFNKSCKWKITMIVIVVRV